MTVEDLASDKELNELAQAIREALQQLLAYARTHDVDDTLAKSLPRLVLAGALSLETGAFLASYKVRFHGFSKRLPVTGVRVFEIARAVKGTPITLLGYRDGTVAVEEMPKNHSVQ